VAADVIGRDPVIDVSAAAGRDQPPGAPTRRQKLVHDHLANVEFRPVQRADPAPADMGPDQRLMDEVIAPDLISSPSDLICCAGKLRNPSPSFQ